MSRLAHVTPRYIVDRLSLMAYERRRPDDPWLTSRMIEMLAQLLRPTDVGLEWGSGRSTVWFASRVHHMMTVEDDPAWCSQVDAMLVKRNLRDRVALNLLESRPEADGPAVPYVAITRTIAPETLDFCLVDGSQRDHCAMAALSLLKPGGLLIIDNVERYLPSPIGQRSPNSRTLEQGCASAEWTRVAGAIADWRSIWTTNGIFDTALWVKPASTRKV